MTRLTRPTPINILATQISSIAELLIVALATFTCPAPAIDPTVRDTLAHLPLVCVSIRANLNDPSNALVSADVDRRLQVGDRPADEVKIRRTDACGFDAD